MKDSVQEVGLDLEFGTFHKHLEGGPTYTAIATNGKYTAVAVWSNKDGAKKSSILVYRNDSKSSFVLPVESETMITKLVFVGKEDLAMYGEGVLEIMGVAGVTWHQSLITIEDMAFYKGRLVISVKDSDALTLLNVSTMRVDTVVAGRGVLHYPMPLRLAASDKHLYVSACDCRIVLSTL
jgi:hypothetical protein